MIAIGTPLVRETMAMRLKALEGEVGKAILPVAGWPAERTRS